MKLRYSSYKLPGCHLIYSLNKTQNIDHSSVLSGKSLLILIDQDALIIQVESDDEEPWKRLG